MPIRAIPVSSGNESDSDDVMLLDSRDAVGTAREPGVRQSKRRRWVRCAQLPPCMGVCRCHSSTRFARLVLAWWLGGFLATTTSPSLGQHVCPPGCLAPSH